MVCPSIWTYMTLLNGAASGELGALSMDNNSAAVTFPDFTRGHRNDQKGYSHAYAAPEDEAAAEAAAKAYTAAQKAAVADNKLWDLLRCHDLCLHPQG